MCSLVEMAALHEPEDVELPVDVDATKRLLLLHAELPLILAERRGDLLKRAETSIGSKSTISLPSVSRAFPS